MIHLVIVFSKYRKLDMNDMENLNNKNFEKLNNSFKTNNLDNLNIFYNTDNENTNSSMNEFSDNFKQFLMFQMGEGGGRPPSRGRNENHIIKYKNINKTNKILL